MIGRLLLTRPAVLTDRGVWKHPDPETAAYLNGRFNPAVPFPGDHHRPFGAACVERAGLALGVGYEVSTPTHLPLPDGAVS